MNGHTNDKMYKMLQINQNNHEYEKLQEEDIAILVIHPSNKGQSTSAKQIEDAPFNYPLMEYYTKFKYWVIKLLVLPMS